MPVQMRYLRSTEGKPKEPWEETDELWEDR
jgi:hypothetical protein